MEIVIIWILCKPSKMFFVTVNSEKPIGQRQTDVSSLGSFLPANPPIGGDCKEMEII